MSYHELLQIRQIVEPDERIQKREIAGAATLVICGEGNAQLVLDVVRDIAFERKSGTANLEAVFHLVDGIPIGFILIEERGI